MKRLFTLLSLFLALCVTAAELRGKCIRVTDGDTITVQEADGTKFRVRLAAIDAPEMKQPFGIDAKRHLSKLLLDKEVFVKIKGADRYGRLIGRVSADGKDAGTEMLRAGFAWHYAAFDSDPDAYQLQLEAKTERRGLWIQTAPVPPWEFR